MRLAAALLAAVGALALAACGGAEEVQPLPEGVTGTTPPAATTETQPEDGGEGNAAAGEDVYASAGCGSCHVLAAAGSSGTIGPNLDETKPELDLIVERVTNGASPMPAFKDQLTEQQIQDVAAFVFESTR
ncbi:MAG: c-type cytochrome [Gaiellaceae bacterium]